MFTVLATLFGILLIVGGIANILGNLKEFKEIMKGIGTVLVGFIVLALCMGWKPKKPEINFWFLVFLKEIRIINVIWKLIV